MADASKKTAITNTTPKSSVDVTCDCSTIWSLAQQFSTTRLAVETGEHKGELVEDYAVRARRIAATYARFYLEIEDGGSLEKLGRYYWMALGAFASKTVACALESVQIRLMTPVISAVHDGLGKGNLWLFCDISGWHWYYNNFPDSFQKCINERNALKYSAAVRNQMEELPWKAHALPAVKNFGASSEIKQGFELIRKLENITEKMERQRLQFGSLMAIANHEQGVILQPLIYDDKLFATWVQRQRGKYMRRVSPDLELVFTHECTSKHSSVKSVAPLDTELENLSSRMTWIKSAAIQFHTLMTKREDFMHAALRVMSGWKDTPDTPVIESGMPL